MNGYGGKLQRVGVVSISPCRAKKLEALFRFVFEREGERESGGPYLHIYSFSRKSTKSYLTKKNNK